MVYQSKRLEWRKKQRRRKRNLLILKTLILILSITGIGYMGTRLYGKYNAEASKDTPSYGLPDIDNSTDNLVDINNSDKTNTADEPSTNTNGTENSNSSEKSQESKKPDASQNPGEEEKNDASQNSDEKEKTDTSQKPDKPNKPDKSNKSDHEKNDGNTDKVNESYFDDAVFVGDSRTEGFGLYSGLKNATIYSEKGLMVDTIFKDKAVKINGKKVTIMEALKSRSFGKVYIMLGVNELGWPNDDIFINQYKKVIDAVKEAQPQATIYIQSIIHVSQEKDKNPPSYISNKQINQRNKLIKKMAEEENVTYLDVNEVLTDSTGSLFADASTDGLHLNKNYCLIWKDYLLKNTIN